MKIDTVHQESLQCLGCAAYQELGDALDVKTLWKLMYGGNQKVEKHPDNDVIWDSVGIDSRIKKQLIVWAEQGTKNDKEEKYLKKWLNSSIWVAKALKNDNIYEGSDYRFYRVDQFPGRGKYKDFKETFAQILKDIKSAANNTNLDDWDESVKVYADKNIKLMPDKWNPADFIAIQKNKELHWKDVIHNFITNTGKHTTLANDLEKFLLKQKDDNTSKTKPKIEILMAMAILYEYNKKITKGITDREFIPISLKLTEIENPGVTFSKIAEPTDLEKYFHLKIKTGKFEYSVKNQEAKFWFQTGGPNIVAGSYTFTMRTGASVEKVSGDVTNELKDLGVASAQAGKVAFSVSTKIAKLSGGRRGFTALKKKRRELWEKYTPKGSDDPTKGVFWDHTVSRTHGFTDWRVFDKLASVHSQNLKIARKELAAENAKELDREELGFDRRISDRGAWKGRPVGVKKRFIMNEDPTGIVNDIKMWAEYADWLSGGETKMGDFMKEALGRNQWNEVLKQERRERQTSKKPERRKPDWRYNITLSQVQTKYMKSKIQAYEQAFILDPDSSDKSKISLQMKRNIIKGMWMYAASKGFVIFKRGNVKSYLLSGSYIKCAA